MPKLLRILNFIAIAFFAITGVVLVVLQPSTPVWSFANLLPFGSVLIAAQVGSKPVASWLALGLNALWSVCLLALIGAAVLGNIAMPLVVALVGIVLAIPCVLNVNAMWTLRRGAKNG